MQEAEETGWMVIVRWRGGRDNKPPKGECLHLRGVSEGLARSAAAVMMHRLPNGCSTTYSAERMPDYLKRSE